MNLHFAKQMFPKQFNYKIVNLDTLETVFSHNLRNVIPQDLWKNKLVNLCYTDDNVVHFTITSETESNSEVLVDDLIDIIVDDNYKLMNDKTDKPQHVNHVDIKDGTFLIYFK